MIGFPVLRNPPKLNLFEEILLQRRQFVRVIDSHLGLIRYNHQLQTLPLNANVHVLLL